MVPMVAAKWLGARARGICVIGIDIDILKYYFRK
jgi:hypothetical protein